MREVMPVQRRLNQTDIADIKISARSRDDTPDILKGLQYIYINEPLREQLFLSLDQLLTDKQKRLGRKGMDLWSVFVLATLRVNLNWDYDRLEHMVNEHRTIRKIIGHGGVDDEYEYSLQTLKDNVQLLTPEILDEINLAVVNAGHGLAKKKDGDTLSGRCDSFVVETNVHFPSDVGLLFDALRKSIQLTHKVCVREGQSDWRQSAYNIRCIKQAWRKVQKSKKGGGKGKEARVLSAHKEYVDIAMAYLVRLRGTFAKIEHNMLSLEIKPFLEDADRQIDQIRRRAIEGESIPSSEKVFSLFERHTEWVNKGKAGGKIELGIKVCIVEDQYQFILQHRVMENESDSCIAELIVKETQVKYPDFKACSFDKGFDSAENQIKLKKILDTVTMPRKGKLSQERHAEEHTREFIKTRHQHSAVESAINCLEHHGLDKCMDKGIGGFKRYVAMAIVSKNIQRIGVILRAREKAKEQRRQKKQLKAA